jgi:hypothetical protein
MKKTVVFLCLMVIIFCNVSHVLALSVVVPNSMITTEGEQHNIFPFLEVSGTDQMRYQQVFAATEFSAFTGPMWISRVAFRPDAVYRTTGTYVIPDIQINLSTTNKQPDALESMFALNTGPDNTVVYNRGALSLSSNATGPTSGPLDFDIIITFHTPFLYDPNAGNLLLDVRTYQIGDISSNVYLILDAQDTPNDSISRLYSRNVYDDYGTTGASWVSLGLIAQFTAEPIPEPSTMVLLGVGLVVLVHLRRKFKP